MLRDPESLFIALVFGFGALLAGAAEAARVGETVPDGAMRLAAAGPRTATITNPSVRGYRLDRCLYWAQQCDEPAATAWCRTQGYQRATQWQWGYVKPTMLLGDGKVCDADHCGGFSSITCTDQVTAQAPGAGPTVVTPPSVALPSPRPVPIAPPPRTAAAPANPGAASGGAPGSLSMYNCDWGIGQMPGCVALRHPLPNAMTRLDLNLFGLTAESTPKATPAAQQTVIAQLNTGLVHMLVQDDTIVYCAQLVLNGGIGAPLCDAARPTQGAGASGERMVINAVDSDPRNRLFNCATNRVPFGRDGMDLSRCFTFTYRVPAGGIASARLHVAMKVLEGSTDWVIMAHDRPAGATGPVAKAPPPVGGGQYLGCFKDQGAPAGTQGRDLNGAIRSDPGMTTAMCVNECRAKNFAYAATQYSSYCFCGSSYGKSGTANNCNMRCAGNAGETCGGAYANSVYATGPIQPPPPTIAKPPPTTAKPEPPRLATPTPAPSVPAAPVERGAPGQPGALGMYNCRWGIGEMPGCVGLHYTFRDGDTQFSLDLFNIAGDPTARASPQAQQAVIAQLRTGVLDALLQDDTIVYCAQLVLNGGLGGALCDANNRTRGAGAAGDRMVINAVDNDPQNRLWNCATNRVAFGRDGYDLSRCFSFVYPVPPSGIRSATLHIAFKVLEGSTDALIMALGRPAGAKPPPTVAVTPAPPPVSKPPAAPAPQIPRSDPPPTVAMAPPTIPAPRAEPPRAPPIAIAPPTTLAPQAEPPRVPPVLATPPAAGSSPGAAGSEPRVATAPPAAVGRPGAGNEPRVATGPQPIPPRDKPRGPCDGDARLTSLHARCALEMSVKLIGEDSALDLDGDQGVTSRDAVIILQRAVGK